MHVEENALRDILHVYYVGCNLMTILIWRWACFCIKMNRLHAIP